MTAAAFPDLTPNLGKKPQNTLNSVGAVKGVKRRQPLSAHLRPQQETPWNARTPDRLPTSPSVEKFKFFLTIIWFC